MDSGLKKLDEMFGRVKEVYLKENVEETPKKKIVPKEEKEKDVLLESGSKVRKKNRKSIKASEVFENLFWKNFESFSEKPETIMNPRILEKKKYLT